jgi:hypothetical protein
MQVAATPMPTWRALAVSSAIGTPVVVSTYIIINNNFSKQKFFLPKQGKGVLWYTTTISDPSFSNPDPLKFVRPINRFRQTHHSILSGPPISSVLKQNTVPVLKQNYGTGIKNKIRYRY